MKKNTLLIIGGVIVAYYLWKKSQEETETTSEFSNVGGKGRRRKLDKAQNSLCKMCIRKNCGQTAQQKVSCSGVCGCPSVIG